jgi:hypothetical protein
MANADADFTGPLQDKRQRVNLVRFLELGCPDVATLDKSGRPVVPASVEVAKALLGDDFISPVEPYDRKFSSRYSYAQMERLRESIPSLLTINWLRENDYLLIPGPTVTMSLRSIYQEFRQYFQQTWMNDDGPWFMYHEYEALITDVVKPATWWAVCKRSSRKVYRTPVYTVEEESFRRQELDMNVAEMTYCLVACSVLRGMNMFDVGWSTMTSTRISPSVPVQVMVLENGIDVFTV